MVSISEKYIPNVFICRNWAISGLRNYGSKIAKGEIYAFIDADCVADKDWLKNAAEYLTKETCMIGSLYSIPTNAKWIEKAWFSRKPKGRCEVTFFNSGNMKTTLC